jgi:hypothetical protein
MLRWDKTGRLEPTELEPITLTYLTNYTIEAGPFPAFVINAKAGTCQVDGADQWYDWGYGSDRAMTLTETWTEGNNEFKAWTNFAGQGASKWISKSNGADASTCFPVAEHHQDTSIQWGQFSEAPIDASVWNKPDYCKFPFVDVKHGCGGEERHQALLKLID